MSKISHTADILAANAQLNRIRTQHQMSVGSIRPNGSGWLGPIEKFSREEENDCVGADGAIDAPSVDASSLSTENGVSKQPLQRMGSSLGAPFSAETKRTTVRAMLWAAAAERGKLIEIRMWELIRLLDTTGRGYVELATIRRELSLGGKFGYANRRTINAHLRRLFSAEFAHVSRDKNVLLYRSMPKVHVLLGTFARGHRVELSISELCGSNTDIRALAHALMLVGRSSESPVSRSVITQETGRHRRTQRKYETVRGVKKQSNFAFWRKFTPKGELYTHEYHKHRIGRVTMSDGTSGLAILEQLPNTYKDLKLVKLKPARTGLNRSISNLHSKRWANSHAVAAGSSESDNDNKPTRSYYETADDAREAQRITQFRTNRLNQYDNGRIYVPVFGRK